MGRDWKDTRDKAGQTGRGRIDGTDGTGQTGQQDGAWQTGRDVTDWMGQVRRDRTGRMGWDRWDWVDQRCSLDASSPHPSPTIPWAINTSQIMMAFSPRCCFSSALFLFWWPINTPAATFKSATAAQVRKITCDGGKIKQ